MVLYQNVHSQGCTIMQYTAPAKNSSCSHLLKVKIEYPYQHPSSSPAWECGVTKMINSTKIFYLLNSWRCCTFSATQSSYPPAMIRRGCWPRTSRNCSLKLEKDLIATWRRFFLSKRFTDRKKLQVVLCCGEAIILLNDKIIPNLWQKHVGLKMQCLLLIISSGRGSFTSFEWWM